jgi:hypothetical protein
MTTPLSDPSPSALEQEPGGKMSFFEHLVDLRKRLINSALAIAVGAGIGVSISQRVFGWIALPMRDAPAFAPACAASPTSRRRPHRMRPSLRNCAACSDREGEIQGEQLQCVCSFGRM